MFHTLIRVLCGKGLVVCAPRETRECVDEVERELDVLDVLDRLEW